MSNLDPEHRNDPLNDVFPKVKVFLKTTFISNIYLTIIGCPVKVKVNVYLKKNIKVAKCSFSKYGSSGTVEKYDGLCILSLNIFNEKVLLINDVEKQNDHEADLDPDLHPDLVLVCLPDSCLWSQSCLEGESFFVITS